MVIFLRKNGKYEIRIGNDTITKWRHNELYKKNK